MTQGPHHANDCLHLQATSGDKKESIRGRGLQFGGGGFGGALLTTGSFTMMAASGGF